MFNFNQLLYDNQGTENTGWLDDNVIKSAAASIPGLDASRFQSDRGSDGRQERAGHDRLAGRQGGCSAATPTIYVVHKGGKPQLVTLSSPGDPSALETAINTG